MQRNIEKEYQDARLRESEIAKELRLAREDFSDAERQYRALSKQYHRIEAIHNKKVLRGEMESSQEKERLKKTKEDMERFRKSLDEKEKLLKIARSAEYNYRKHEYEMKNYMRPRNPISRFFEWAASIPTRIADKITDTFFIPAEQKRLNSLPEKERQEEIRQIRAAYALDQAERKLERAATAQAKEFILDHPEVGIKNYFDMDERQQDMVTAEKMIALCGRTGQTLYMGIGTDSLLKMEMMDDEISGGSAYVSVRMVDKGMDREGNPVLSEGKEIAHVHLASRGGNAWAVDMQSASEVQLEAALSAGRDELSKELGYPSGALRKLSREEAEAVAAMTLDDAARKREALEREYGSFINEGVKDAGEKDVEKEGTKAHEKEEKESAVNTRKENPVEMQGKTQGKTDRENDDVEKTGQPAREEPRDPERKALEKKIEKAVRELHKGYRGDKTLENHKHPVTVSVDRYQVAVCPPNAKHETAYYTVDGRYAGKYMKSMSNPKITMEYIRNHHVLDNPVKTISTEKLDDLQLAGNIARGLMFDINHGTQDVPGYISELKTADVERTDPDRVAEFLSADLKKYPEQEAAQTISNMYRRIQSYDMDDSLRDNTAAKVYLNVYTDYMQREELSHSGGFSTREVDYVAADGTLFDMDGKVFLSEEGKVITLDNCEDYCPKDEKMSIREDLEIKREADLGHLEEVMEDPIGMEDYEAEREGDDWLIQEEERGMGNEHGGFDIPDDGQSFPPEKSQGPDFLLQANTESTFEDYDEH